jgi:hemerythrin-like domain-containing protein
MNVFQLLKEDHKEVAKMMNRLEETTENAVKTREELFVELKKELDVHAFVEETYLYPLLKDVGDTKKITMEAYEEHRLVKILLEELDDLAKDAEEWGPKFKVLKENVEHHVEEEEGELFKKAQKVLGDDKAEVLGAEIATEKAKLKATA